MRKSMIMVLAMVAVGFTMGSVFGQCCGGKQCRGDKWKAANNKSSMCCPMKKGVSKVDMKKMMANCPMMKNMSEADKKKMMSNCPMMKFMMSTDKNKKAPTKEQMAKMMASCPMMKNMSDVDKKKMMSRCMSMMNGKCKTGNRAMREQTTCPVMKGNKINKNLYVDAEGKRIYVCCGACLAIVKKDPKKYIKELEAKGVKLQKTPKK